MQDSASVIWNYVAYKEVSTAWVNIYVDFRFLIFRTSFSFFFSWVGCKNNTLFWKCKQKCNFYYTEMKI